MKNIISLALSIAITLLMSSCSEKGVEGVDPVVSHSGARTSGKPDLKIFKASFSGGSYGDGTGGRVYVVHLIETNVGTELSKPTDIYVYHRTRAIIGTTVTYSLRYLRSFRRSSNLAPGDLWVAPSSTADPSTYIWIRREYRTGANEELVFSADGPNYIDELDETNNMSKIVTVY
ncbi:hypothetical protein GCM10028805_57270 [Spirosoma harenae]